MMLPQLSISMYNDQYNSKYFPVQVNSELEPPQPSVPAATTPNLTTNQKFGYC